MIFYKTLTTIKAMSFDLDDTLYNNHPPLVAAEEALQDYIHGHYPKLVKPPSFWKQQSIKAIAEQPGLAQDIGRLRKQSLLHGFVEAGYNGEALEQAAQDCFEHFYFHRSNFKVDEKVRTLLANLASKLPLVAITNGNVNLEQLKIGEYFKHVLRANIHSPMKPHPSMFKQTSSLLGLPAQQILHVGDHLKKDVAGAIDSSFQTAWFAYNRKMVINQESCSVLPHVQLHTLDELLVLLP